MPADEASAQFRFAEVAVGLPLRTTFHYRIPAEFKKQIAAGQRVRVPFGRRHIMGIVVGFVPKAEVSSVKPIAGLLDEKPVFEPDILELTKWMARTYQAGWGQTLESALPGPLRRGRSSMTPREEESLQEILPNPPHMLTGEQNAAYQEIRASLDSLKHQIFLLHGVTGSGKTEVYLQAIQRTLEKGRSSIVLVPEISLTPQAIERFQGRFGRKQVALLHSGMLESRRLQEWRRIESGQARVVIGARSAVFAPAKSLGLIVVDEEHEPSYKQSDAPRYHAREVAIRRGELSGGTVILGSATPSLESYYLASSGRYRLLQLKKRVDAVPLPQVEIVDMREEFSLRKRSHIFSRALEEAIAKTLEENQQTILFLNRRGFSTFVQCKKCGHTMKCTSCQVSLTYHIETKLLICHYCHASLETPKLCPECRSEYVRFKGTGTQRVESELARHFPGAKIARMDTDSTKVRGSHEKILTAFRKGEIDVLVGTQMVAKGLDYPRVTLVGVISADTALNLPDFRSAERTFSLITQVAGRAGRSSLPGKVIVQTCTPHHYGIQAASRHDYESFYRQEIQIRRELGLPPFTRLVQLTIRSPKESKAIQAAEDLSGELRRCLPANSAEILGPSPAAIPRLRRQYRWQILVKAKSLENILPKLEEALSHRHLPKGSYLAVDVDPL